jgi:hypothetical protein
MHSEEIFGPFIAMMLLTFIVWVVMYVRRLHYIISNRIDTRQLTTPEKGAKLIAEKVSWPAYNFRNLFELPVLFYALCLYLFATGNVDTMFVSSAWLFVALRSVHSLVHCTRNIVKLRFMAYMLGAIVLWFMIIRAAWQLFAD